MKMIKLMKFIEKYDDDIARDKNKIYDMLDKFKDNIENNMNNLDKRVIDKENNLHARLNKLNDDVKKINKYNKKSIEIIYVM